MSRADAWSRRGLMAATLSAFGFAGTPAPAQEAEARDRGLGGTGVVPGEPEGSDRGIGGTGVVGTIRRFGSIVVNDLRITFPRDVRVRIDGRPATVRELRVGHVVHVLARQQGGTLVTAGIAADSEVVGPVEALTAEGLVVLGQKVACGPDIKDKPRRIGQWVAVSGLRRLDGVIAASRIAKGRRGHARVAGRPQADGSGSIGIGALGIDGLPADAVGRRVVVAGTMVGGRLAARSVETPWSDLLAARPNRLSLEDYVALDADGLRFASGLPAVAGSAVGQTPEETRAIVSATVTPEGHIEVEGIRAEGRHGASRSNSGEPSGPARGGPPGPGPNGPGGMRPDAHGPEGFGSPPPGGPHDDGGPGRWGGPGGRGGPGPGGSGLGGSGPGGGGGRR